MKKKTTEKKRQQSKFFSFGLGHEKDNIIASLSMMLSAGVRINDALLAVKKEIKSNRLKKVIDVIIEDIDAGSSISEAFEKTKLFSTNITALIKTGEESGKLSESLKLVADNQEKDRTFRDRLRSAMLYPVFIFVVLLIVSTGIVWFILPRLSTVFNSMNFELPKLTQFIIAAGTFLKDHGNVAVPGFLIAVFAIIYLIFYFTPTKIIGQFIIFHTPGLKNLTIESELARFGYVMASLLNAGLSVNQALESIGETTTTENYKRFFKYLVTSINNGNNFEKSFEEYKKLNALMPPTIASMIVFGEKSGHLPEAFQKIGEIYEAKTELTTKNFAVMVEPILLVLVWLGVVVIALAVIMPIYSLIGNFSNTY